MDNQFNQSSNSQDQQSSGNAPEQQSFEQAQASPTGPDKGGNKPMMSGNKNRNWIGVVVLIVLIALIILVSAGGDDESENGMDVINGDDTSMNGDDNATTTDENGTAGTSTRMSPVTVAGDTYAFREIDWLFAAGASANTTMVRIQFVDFTRNRVDINVLPYRLGEYAGTCKEIAVPANAGSLVSGSTLRPLTFAECTSSQGRRQFGIYQNGRFVETYMRVASANASFGIMSKIQTIDLAGIVE